MNEATGRRACSQIASCELYPKFSLRGALNVWQRFYCEGRFESCARYKLALSGRPAPPHLLPSGHEFDLDVLLPATGT
ncbi:MAG TPA: hypothetical protein VIW03_09270 [Anaeromyxobacter sp.]